jgi:hypothetical protein
MAKVFRLTPEKSKIKGSFSSQAKRLQNASSGSMGSSSEIWSSDFRLINRFLNRKIKSQFKNPDAEVKTTLHTNISP